MICKVPTCKAFAVRGDPDGRCFYHSRDPQRITARDEARSRGGKNGSHRVEPPHSIAQVSTVMAQVLADLLPGKLPIAQAEAAAKVAGLILKGIEATEIDARLKRIEERNAKS